MKNYPLQFSAKNYPCRKLTGDRREGKGRARKMRRTKRTSRADKRPSEPGSVRERRRGVAAAGPSAFGAAYGRWMMSNVRREIAAGRVRQTIDETGDVATIH